MFEKAVHHLNLLALLSRVKENFSFFAHHGAVDLIYMKCNENMKNAELSLCEACSFLCSNAEIRRRLV
jgi:hypothetical protein